MNNLDLILEKQRQIVKKIKAARSHEEVQLLSLEFLALHLQFQQETYKEDIKTAREPF